MEELPVGKMGTEERQMPAVSCLAYRGDIAGTHLWTWHPINSVPRTVGSPRGSLIYRRLRCSGDQRRATWVSAQVRQTMMEMKDDGEGRINVMHIKKSMID